MNILHVTEHMGDGAGKAIGGLAILGNLSDESVQHILLLDGPKKYGHINRCKNAGVQVFSRDMVNEKIAWADIVVLNWWGGRITDDFLSEFPDIPCRVILWSHKNGFFDPPLPHELVTACDYLLVTSPFMFENPVWMENSALVYGFGDFLPSALPRKTDYSFTGGAFTIGYVGSPSYKKLPSDFLDYCAEVLHRVPGCRFVLAGETSDELRRDIYRRDMNPYFELLGWQSNIEALLCSFDVFGYLLRPNTFATTENAVLEAMSAAVPTIVSRKPLGSYLLEDKVSGFLVESPEEYGMLMLKLYENEYLRKCVGEAGREHVIKAYRADENLWRFSKACKTAMRKEKRIHSFKRGDGE